MKKSILIGIVIFILGFVISALLGNYLKKGNVKYSYLESIIFSILITLIYSFLSYLNFF